jgi:hypothetical protein
MYRNPIHFQELKLFDHLTQKFHENACFPNLKAEKSVLGLLSFSRPAEKYGLLDLRIFLNERATAAMNFRSPTSDLEL